MLGDQELQMIVTMQQQFMRDFDSYLTVGTFRMKSPLCHCHPIDLDPQLRSGRHQGIGMDEIEHQSGLLDSIPVRNRKGKTIFIGQVIQSDRIRAYHQLR